MASPLFPENCGGGDRAFKSGDYAAAKAKAEEWLTLDPFSIGAYKLLIFAIARGGQTLPKEGARSVNDIVGPFSQSTRKIRLRISSRLLTRKTGRSQNHSLRV